MRTTVTVVEVSPRDGLQNEPELLATQEKLALVQHAIDSGARRIEVTSFVHPKLVPQMADAEAVCAGLPERDDVRFTGLVLNWKGYERACATGRIDEVGMVVPATDTFGERNQGQRVADAVAEGRAILKHAREHGMRAQATIAVAFGCPFERDVPVERLCAIAAELAEEHPVEIGLADTIGVGVPSQVKSSFEALRRTLGTAMPLRAHFHNTRNTGIANAYAALEADVDFLDASIGGIGGCPFAPKASGNIATEDLVYMLDRMNVRHGLGLERLLEASHWLEGALGKPLPSMVGRAGGFP